MGAVSSVQGFLGDFTWVNSPKCSPETHIGKDFHRYKDGSRRKGKEAGARGAGGTGVDVGGKGAGTDREDDLFDLEK